MGILACSFLLLLLLMILTVLVPIGIAGILRWRIEVFKKENSKFQSIVQHLYDMQYADASDLFDTRLVCLCKNLSIGDFLSWKDILLLLFYSVRSVGFPVSLRIFAH